MYKDAAQIRMAGGLGGYQQFRLAKRSPGAGEGMARGGDGGGGGGGMLAGAGLGVGIAMANMFAQSTRPAAEAPAPAQAAPAAPGAAEPSGPAQEAEMLKEEGLIDDQEYAAKRRDTQRHLTHGPGARFCEPSPPWADLRRASFGKTQACRRRCR